MDAIERDVMRSLVTDLVETMQAYDIPPEAVAAAFGEQLVPADLEDCKANTQVWAAVERRVAEARAAHDVLVSCARAAQLTAMTRQGISDHVKRGNLPAIKLRVAGRSRLGIPLTSLCDYFGIAAQRLGELTADLPRDAAGNIETVFWDWTDEPAQHPDAVLAALEPAVVTRAPWPRPPSATVDAERTAPRVALATSAPE